MAKSSLNHAERQRLEFLTSHLRGSARPSVKAKYEAEIETLLAGKELTRGDIALAAYYAGNSGTAGNESRQLSQEFAAIYRAMPNE